MKRICLLMVCCVTACLLSSCALLPQEETVRTAPVVRSYTRPEYHTVPVERSDLTEYAKISCNYVPVQTATLSFQMDDEFIDRYLVQAGDAVTEGQLLAQLQLGDLEERIAAMENEMAVYQVQLDYAHRYYELEQKKLSITAAGLSAEERREAQEAAREDYLSQVESLEGQLTYRRLTLDALNRDLAKRQIRAPFSGTLTRVADYEDGDKSEFGIGVITLVDATRSIFRASTDHWDRFAPGERHTITVRKVEYEAVVMSATELGLQEPVREEGKRSYVYFALTEPAFELEDGDTGTVEIVLNALKDVLHVPAKAVAEADGRPIVYYLREDGMKAYKYVETGLTISARTEILSGLEEGESVVIK